MESIVLKLKTEKLKLPPGVTEEGFINTINIIANKLGFQFKFGYFEAEDMQQQIRLFAIKALEKYDCRRPLENFLYVNCRNRLINFKRDNYKRSRCPCLLCLDADSAGSKHGPHEPDNSFCKRYKMWKKSNKSKQNLMYLLNIDNINDENEKNARCDKASTINQIEYKELLDKIDLILPIDLRCYYLQIIDGFKIPRAHRVKVEEAVRSILYAS